MDFTLDIRCDWVVSGKGGYHTAVISRVTDAIGARALFSFNFNFNFGVTHSPNGVRVH